MHITSTINAKTQSTDDVPVVLVTLGGKRKFLPRPETYLEMKRLVRSHYDVDHRAVLQFEVSTWDVCGGQNVEVTEPAYALLAPLLDSVSVVVSQAGRDRVIPTPSATPPLHADEGSEDEDSVREQLEPEPTQSGAPETPLRRVPKVEPEDEEEMHGESRYEEGDAEESTNVQEEEEESRTPQVSNQQVYVQAREASSRTPRAGTSAKPIAGNSRGASNRSEETAESSQVTGSDAEERFKVHVTGPRASDKVEIITRGKHTIRKVLAGVCKTFRLDPGRARLLLYVETPDDEGQGYHFECAPEETVARSGVTRNSQLVVRVVEEEAEAEDEYSD
ncbi:hypothetical protein DFH07DRAFT_911040 [Mycena maculata]|uniref:Uncharacterized protein n=1 Tax=Mycena maculata TaxID=230809 RepID=A0AAD7K5B4_9AGAR|nr:hypothetical protein DFH07DRAFT_911040 [Mycena maculata]